MKEHVFLVQGSAKEPYKVSFQKSNDKLSAYCNCPAGDNGQICKHRLNILGGLSTGIVSGNETDVQIVASWLAGTYLEEAMNSVMYAEERCDHAKRELFAAKKRLADAIK